MVRVISYRCSTDRVQDLFAFLSKVTLESIWVLMLLIWHYSLLFSGVDYSNLLIVHDVDNESPLAANAIAAAPAMPITAPDMVEKMKGTPLCVVGPGSLPEAPNSPFKAKRSWYVLCFLVVWPIWICFWKKNKMSILCTYIFVGCHFTFGLILMTAMNGGCNFRKMCKFVSLTKKARQQWLRPWNFQQRLCHAK